MGGLSEANTYCEMLTASWASARTIRRLLSSIYGIANYRSSVLAVEPTRAAK